MADTKINDTNTITVEIDGFNNKYLGLAKYEGKKVLVSNALPGETIECFVLRNWKSKILAVPEKIIEPSPDRVEPGCQHFSLCAGCQFQHLNYDKQLELKKDRTLKFIERQNPELIDKFEKIIPSSESYGYRNTIKLHGPGEPGFWKIAGIEILKNSECPVCIPAVENKLLELRNNNFSPFFEEDIKNVMIRGSSCGEVYAGPEQLKDKETVWLSEELPDPLTGDIKRIEVPVHSFWQGSTAMIPELIRQVVEPISLHKPDVLIEAYCGVGVFSLFSAAVAKNIIAIEENSFSVAAARKNKDTLGIDNMRVMEGKTEEELESLLKQTPATGTSLIVDPPRSGLQKKVLKQILAHPPEQLIYVSCNPDSLARNLNLLCENSYRAERIRGLDLFPHTKHLECVAVLHRNK